MSRETGTRRVATNKRRQGALALALPWLRRYGPLAGGGILSVWIGAWLYFGGGGPQLAAFASEESLRVSAAAGFRVENALVEGRTHADADAIMALVGAQKGSPIFAIDPAALKNAIEKIDWVRTARVERRLPDTVYIRIEERAPLALWQKDQTLRLIDDEGKPILHAHLEGSFRNLPIVMGEGAPENAPGLMRALEKQPSVKAKVSAAKWIDGRRWDLELQGGVTVKLPEGEIAPALTRLAESMSKDKLLEKDITGVDLRENGRIAVMTRPGAIEAFKAGKEAAAKAGDSI